jgi:hypothetical protein
MGIADFFKKKETPSSNFSYSWNGGPMASTTEAAGFPPKISKLSYEAPAPQPLYKIPPVIPVKHHPIFIEQARKVGLTPEEFGMIAAREQGATTTADQAALVGGMDPTDRGVMQVNKLNEPLIQQKFKQELGRPYNPNNAIDSILAARMVLEEHRRQFEQMRFNQTYTNPYSNQDLIDSYNTGVGGFVKAKQGDPDRVVRLTRYQNAGQ